MGRVLRHKRINKHKNEANKSHIYEASKKETEKMKGERKKELNE
jgi:hypothetical protein